MPDQDGLPRRWILLFSAFAATMIACSGFLDTGEVDLGLGPFKLDVTSESLSSGLEALVIDSFDGRIDSNRRAQASVAVDSGIEPILVYRKNMKEFQFLDQLAYAVRRADGKWISARLGSVGTDHGDYSSVLADEDDNIHICFSALREDEGEALYYAKSDNAKKVGSWKVRCVDETENVGLENDIALDSLGHVHMSHWSWRAASLVYTTNASGRWRSEILEAAVWRPTSIAIDAQDCVHISFVDAAGILSHLTNESGTWENTTIPSGGSNSVLRLDSTGRIHVLSTDGSSLFHSVRQGGLWSTSQVPFDYAPAYVNQGSSLSMAVTNDDSIMAVYVVTDQGGSLSGGLYFASSRGGWQSHLLDDRSGYANPSIAVGSDGHAHVGVVEFKKQDEHILKYIAFDPTQL